MKVTVLGATGRTGRHLVPQLVAAGHDVTAVVRREDQLPHVAALGASGVLGNVEGGVHGDLAPAFRGADVVVWSVGATGMDAPGHPERIRDGGIRAVAAAASAGVGRWIQVSSMYANRAELAPPPLRPSMVLKYDVDKAVERSGVPFTIVRPGGLGDGPALGTVAIATELAPGMVMRADVAAVVVELVSTGAGGGASFDLVNGGTPVAEAVAAL